MTFATMFDQACCRFDAQLLIPRRRCARRAPLLAPPPCCAAASQRRGQLDVTQGNVAADADRAAGFRRRQLPATATSRATSRRSSPPISSAPGCSRRSIRPPIIERITQHRRGAALSRLARHQRAGAGHRPLTRQAGRPAEGRVPAVGRVRRPAARRPAVFHRARQLAPHRATSSPTRSTSG